MKLYSVKHRKDAYKEVNKHYETSFARGSSKASGSTPANKKVIVIAVLILVAALLIMSGVFWLIAKNTVSTMDKLGEKSAPVVQDVNVNNYAKPEDL